MVLKTQGQVNMPWIDKVHTMVEAWYPGQEDGNVVADALFGITNFSGKLPVTFGKTDREAAYQSQEQYPGYKEDTGVPGGIGRDPIPGEPQRVVRYTEGLKMGYRWYEATGTKPLFPFGYGLSYTTFRYSNLDVDKIAPRSQAAGRPAGQLHGDQHRQGRRQGGLADLPEAAQRGPRGLQAPGRLPEGRPPARPEPARLGGPQGQGVQPPVLLLRPEGP